MPRVIPASWLSPEQIQCCRKYPLAWTILSSKPNSSSAPKFRPFRHHAIIEPYLRRLADRKDELRRLIISLPRQHSKTETASIGFGSWLAGSNPHLNNAVCSYGSRRSVSIGRACRDKIQRYGPPVFGQNVVGEAMAEWSVSGGGQFFSTGVDGRLNGEAITGCLILDDLFRDTAQMMSAEYRKKIWDWFSTIALPAVGEFASILMVNTRTLPDDVIGRYAYYLGLDNIEVVGHPVTEDIIAKREDFA